MDRTKHTTLGEWMDEKGETCASVAKRLGTTRATVSRWRAGVSFPRRDALDEIFKMTGGVVSADSFRSEAA
ncbi:helix-turn-helix domain-containing protein [Albimonas pacifica]|uniref:Helix-turn-helix n=1 Tax=Albimonas pacifica TaxID=1114924 RepID=A0A1I3LGI5_9RHOB|nr:helix-turn-helix transcriptional regulator [Albimonas pacifica]SFI83556.1 hypothetical protein SAMN05216258_1102 [Albimonas pacifica]